MTVADIFTAYLTVLKKLSFILYSILAGISYSFFIGYCTISPYIYQNILKSSPLQNGFSYLVAFFGLATGAYVVRKLAIKKTTILYLITYGHVLLYIVMMIVGYYYFTFYSMLIFGLLVSFMCGFVAPPLSAFALFQVKNSNPGIGSAGQGVLKVLVTGLSLLIFLHMHISSLYQLASIFFMLALAILLMTYILIASRADSS